MNSRTLTLGFLLGLSAILALIMGQWVATSPEYAVGGSVAVISGLVIFSLGRHLWLLLPFFFGFIGPMPFFPGGFAPREVIVLSVFPILLAQWIIRRFPLRQSFGMIEVALLLFVLLVVQAFVRNPVGLSFLGSDQVGGRPYFEVGIGLLAYLTLSSQVVGLRQVKQAAWGCFIGFMLLAFLETAAGVVPKVAYLLAPIYATSAGGLSISAAGTYVVDTYSVGRIMYLRAYTEPLIGWLLAHRSPLQLLNPFRILSFLVGSFAVICTLLSGFRSGILWILFMAIGAIIVRRRYAELFVMGILGTLILTFLVVGQGQVFNLPAPAQRALSFLPGDWDRVAASDAEGSIDWRVEMWKQALFTDRYIHNKWIGDGFGFSAEELHYQASLQDAGLRPNELQEYYLMVGNYHSGPVEAVRRVGYAGLGFFLIGVFVCSAYAVRLLRRSIGTPFEVPAFFLGLPLVILPVTFIVGAGSLHTAIVQICFMGGMLRVIENSMNALPVESTDPVGTPEPAGRASVPARNRHALTS